MLKQFLSLAVVLQAYVINAEVATAEQDRLTRIISPPALAGMEFPTPFLRFSVQNYPNGMETMVAAVALAPAHLCDGTLTEKIEIPDWDGPIALLTEAALESHCVNAEQFAHFAHDVQADATMCKFQLSAAIYSDVSVASCMELPFLPYPFFW